jgi:predicted DNA-binding transcriptional regulator YafY
MDPSGGRSGRLLSTLLLLQSRGSVTAREIAAYLGVSMRTVYRDIDVLYAIGVPLYAETGRDGGYHLVDGYRTTLTGLTAQESLALFLIGLPAPAASLGLSEQARSAEAKLLAALGQGPREQASRLRDRFLLDLPPWYADSPPPPALPRLADAVLAGQQVLVRYRRWREPREVRRRLDPLGLVVKNGLWYLVAADRTGSRAAAGPVRVYRVSNILELEVLDAVFERPESFDLADFWRDRLAEFDAARLSGTATLRIAAALVERLPDVGDQALTQAVATGTVEESGAVTATLPIESPGHAATHLIRYGDEVEVLAPPELRAALIALATRVLNRYPTP